MQNSKNNPSLKKRKITPKTTYIIKFSILAMFSLIFGIIAYHIDYKNKILNPILNQLPKNKIFLLKNIILDPTDHITKEEIFEILNLRQNYSLFTININHLRKKLESYPTIDFAIIERRFPNTLHISIKENIPIAIWQYNNSISLINKDGNKIEGINLKKYLDLLQVIGEDANIYASQLIQDLNNHKDLSNNLSYAIRQGKRRWDLYFEQGLIVKMPSENFLQAYAFMYDLYKLNKLFSHKIKILDLRDKKKYFIK